MYKPDFLMVLRVLDDTFPFLSNRLQDKMIYKPIIGLEKGIDFINLFRSQKRIPSLLHIYIVFIFVFLPSRIATIFFSLKYSRFWFLFLIAYDFFIYFIFMQTLHSIPTTRHTRSLYNNAITQIQLPKINTIRDINSTKIKTIYSCIQTRFNRSESVPVWVSKNKTSSSMLYTHVSQMFCWLQMRSNETFDMLCFFFGDH